MLRNKFEYSGKSFDIYPYTTHQEKELLLICSVGTPSLDDALQVCGISTDVIKQLSNNEKVALLYKFRELSVGDDLNLKFKCSKCDSGNENVLNISNIITSSDIKNDKIIDQFKTLTEDNFHEFVIGEDENTIDDLDLNEYEDLYKEVEESITKFNFRKPITCQKCNHTNYMKIDGVEFVIDNMSEDSLMSMYQSYNDLTFFGNYTKVDIDTMYSFERTILVNLLNKTREDLNQ